MFLLSFVTGWGGETSCGAWSPESTGVQSLPIDKFVQSTSLSVPATRSRPQADPAEQCSPLERASTACLYRGRGSTQEVHWIDAGGGL